MRPLTTRPTKILVVLSGLLATALHAQDETLYPFQRGTLHGFIDRRGNVVIEPRFRMDRPEDRRQVFAEGLQPVKTSGSGLYGYIDMSGNLVIPARFETARSFSEGMAVVGMVNPEEHFRRRYGFIDRTGAWVVEPTFDQAAPFSEGRACVSVDGKVGYIDVKGRYLIEPRFEGWSDLCSFREGRAAFRAQEAWGFIDASGDAVIPARFESPSSFHDGLAAVELTERGGGYEYVTTDGKRVFTETFQIAWSFSEGLARVELRLEPLSPRENRDRFIDTQGRVVFALPDDVFWVEPFSEGRARVTLRDKTTRIESTGYIDREGRFVIPPRFVWGDSFHGGLAQVEDCGKRGYIDRDGNVVWGFARRSPSGAPDEGRLDAVTAEDVARVAGLTGKLRLTNVPSSLECTPYGKAIWVKVVEASSSGFPPTWIRLLEGDSFLTEEREATFEAVLKDLGSLASTAPIVSRIPMPSGPPGYFAVLGFGPGGSIYAATIPSPNRTYEVQVLVASASEGAEPAADEDIRQYLGWLGRNPDVVLGAVAKAAYEAIFP